MQGPEPKIAQTANEHLAVVARYEATVTMSYVSTRQRYLVLSADQCPHDGLKA